jgi:2-polyprenyl-6-methoxyphenol hydroxylase-like FAD-dependent oxidoreductase
LEKLGALRLAWLSQLDPSLPQRDELMGLEDEIVLTARRPVMEAAFAATAEEQPGVVVRRGVGMAESLVGRGSQPGVPHVVGVRTEAGEQLACDLVVDATGRHTAIAERIEAVGGRRPIETHFENTTIYYSRHYRSRTGTLPAYRGGPLFQAGESIGLFLLIGDNATWCLALWGMAEDKVLRRLRRSDVFDAVVRAFPERAQWLETGLPLGDVVPFRCDADLTRSFLVDGQPVVTGLVAIGDAHAFTEPRLGRGTLLGVMQAVALRDALRAHADERPEAIAVACEEAFEERVGPWLQATNAAGRSFAAEARAYAAAGSGGGGGDAVDFGPARRGVELGQAFERAARVDAEVAQWLYQLAGCALHPRELFGRPGVVDRIMQRGAEVPRGPVEPTRRQLLELLTVG